LVVPFKRKQRCTCSSSATTLRAGKCIGFSPPPSLRRLDGINSDAERQKKTRTRPQKIHQGSTRVAVVERAPVRASTLSLGCTRASSVQTIANYPSLYVPRDSQGHHFLIWTGADAHPSLLSKSGFISTAINFEAKTTAKRAKVLPSNQASTPTIETLPTQTVVDDLFCTLKTTTIAVSSSHDAAT